MMVGELTNVRQQAVLLRDDNVGVTTESIPRKIQRNGDGREFYSTLNRGWLEQLNIKDQSAPTLHSLSMGVKPVIVQHPAIIIQPSTVLEEVDHDV